MPAGMIAIALVRKDYREKGARRGLSIPKLMEEAMSENLGQIVQYVRSNLPSKRMKSKTYIEYTRTSKGASAHLVIGEGVPFTNVQAKWGTSPTVIKPKAPHKYLAIPTNAYGKGLANAAEAAGLGLLKMYGDELHPWWKGSKGKRGGTRGTALFYGKGTTRAFQLVTQSVVKPSVDLYDVQEKMRIFAQIAMERKFEGFDYGFLQMRKEGWLK